MEVTDDCLKGSQQDCSNKEFFIYFYECCSCKVRFTAYTSGVRVNREYLW